MMKIFELAKENTQDSIEKSLKILGVNGLSPQEQISVLDEITKYIFDINQKHSSSEKTFDFYYDYGYYFPDFIEKYGINLNKDEISWWEFDKLLDWCFRDKNSSLYNHMDFRMYKKPSKNQKTAEAEEHKYRMKMKQIHSLPIQIDPQKGLEKLWNYVEKKVGDNKG